MRKHFIWVAVAVFTVMLPVRSTLAWVDTGHSVVALIAWEDLTPKTKAAVIGLLKQHARYEKDLLLDLPEKSTPEETDRYAFTKAATWPDMVRSKANPMNALYNHPNWHYIDIPFVEPGASAPTTEPGADQPGPHNIVEALNKSVVDMVNPSVSNAERAVAICWVEHLVGDIHQPLHATSMYSPDHPQGDRGGNEDEVLRDPPYTDSRANLHLVWDELPGEFHSQLLDRFEAIGLRADPDHTRDKLKPFLESTDFMNWAKESHQLAIEDVYLNGKLETQVVKKGVRSTRGESPPGLPQGYLNKAEHVAMHQIALAGYRLADLLNAKFDGK